MDAQGIVTRVFITDMQNAQATYKVLSGHNQMGFYGEMAQC